MGGVVVCSLRGVAFGAQLEGLPHLSVFPFDSAFPVVPVEDACIRRE